MLTRGHWLIIRLIKKKELKKFKLKHPLTKTKRLKIFFSGAKLGRILSYRHTEFKSSYIINLRDIFKLSTMKVINERGESSCA